MDSSQPKSAVGNRQSQILQASQSNAVRQSEKLRSDVRALTKHPEAAKYSDLADALQGSAELLERIGERLGEIAPESTSEETPP